MTTIKRIPFDNVCQELARILLELGFNEEKAERCARIFTENSCDGVASHGLNRFPVFVSAVKEGTVNIQVEAELVTSIGALEQWDGKRGIGLLNAEIAMKRAVQLAHVNGLGCVGLRNTNHWMRGGTYGLLAAASGCIGLCWTNTTALMPPWGGAEKKIGNNPMVVCVPYGDKPVLLDMAMSQFSNGKLEVLRRRGEQLPLAGGFDESGQLTTDPDAILKSSRALPIGFWKGSGLAVVLDMMAALITGGDATSEISRRENETGVSQVFIAVDIESQLGSDGLDEKMAAIVSDLLETPPLEQGTPVRYPGQGMYAAREENLRDGIPVEAELWETIQRL